MSRLMLLSVVVFVVALTGLVTFGGGWKWRHVSASAPERVAGWIWVDSVTAPASDDDQGENEA